jgi:uncharacterized membrane protein
VTSHAPSRHRVRQLLIVGPLGLLATVVVFDLIDLATATAAFAVPAYWMIAAGVLVAIASAPFELVDWLQIPAGTLAKRLAALHGAASAAVALLFGASWLLRDNDGGVPRLALALTLGAAVLVVLAAVVGPAWLSRPDRSGAHGAGPVSGPAPSDERPAADAH